MPKRVRLSDPQDLPQIKDDFKQTVALLKLSEEKFAAHEANKTIKCEAKAKAPGVATPAAGKARGTAAGKAAAAAAAPPAAAAATASSDDKANKAPKKTPTVPASAAAEPKGDAAAAASTAAGHGPLPLPAEDLLYEVDVDTQVTIPVATLGMFSCRLLLSLLCRARPQASRLLLPSPLLVVDTTLVNHPCCHPMLPSGEIPEVVRQAAPNVQHFAGQSGDCEAVVQLAGERVEQRALPAQKRLGEEWQTLGGSSDVMAVTGLPDQEGILGEIWPVGEAGGFPCYHDSFMYEETVRTCAQSVAIIMLASESLSP